MRWQGADKTLILLVAAAVTLRMVLWAAFPNIQNSDEIFQSLEPAHRLLTGQGVITWEWRQGIRSWMLPGFVAGLMWPTTAMGLPQDVTLGVVAFAMCLLSAVPVAVGYLMGRRAFGLMGGLLAGGVCVFWPELVLFAPKASSDNVAASLFAAAAYLAHLLGRNEAERPGRAALTLGVLAGLIFCVRFHLSLALALLGVWACRKDLKGRWLPFLIGASVPVAAMGVLDLITWGTPFQSIWKNIWINIFESRSERYGVYPLRFYVTSQVKLWNAAVVPMGLLFLVGMRRSPLFVLAAIAIWATHLPLAHKEMRFVLASIPLILIVCALGAAQLLHGFAARRKQSEVRLAAIALAVWAAVAAGVAVGPGFRPNWTNYSDTVRVQAVLRQKEDVCGVGLVGEPWWRTGGYSYLHQDAIIYNYGYDDGGGQMPEILPRIEPSAFNYALTPQRTPIAPEYRVERCIGGSCIQRREGPCTPSPRYEFSQVLAARGE